MFKALRAESSGIKTTGGKPKDILIWNSSLKWINIDMKFQHGAPRFTGDVISAWKCCRGYRPVDWGPLQEEADMMSLRLFAVFALCLAAADGFQLAGTHRLAGRSPRLLLCSAACGVCTLARCGDRVQLARRLMRVALAQRLQLRGPCANRPVRSSQWCRPRSSTRHPPTPPRSLRARALEFQGRVRGCAVRLTSA